MQRPIPCYFMRGGTSHGPFFRAEDLPADIATRDRVLLAVMGSPDARQIDGIGGADPLTSKVGIVSPGKDGVDLEFLFAQVSLQEPRVDTTPKSLEAYKEAALDPWFNQIHTLTWGPYKGGPANPGPGPTTPTTTGDPNTPPVTVKSTGRNGYWMLGSDGKVFAFGEAKHLGAPTLPAGISAADLETTPAGNGYWIVDSAGNVFAYGDAAFHGGISGGLRASQELRLLMTTVNMHALPQVVPVPLYSQHIGEDGVFVANEAMTNGLNGQLSELQKWSGALKSLRPQVAKAA